MTNATTQDNYRIMHTMIRVGDLQRSIDFYCNLLGMHELNRSDVPEASYTNVFLGYGPEATHPGLELTYNYGRTDYEKGNGFGHLAIGVRDIYGVCDRLKAQGIAIAREPGPVKFGTTHIAFVDDPDGYRIELVDLDTTDFAT